MSAKLPGEPPMPRFVILHHETPPGADRAAHYDLMLEQAGVLRTWALPTEPQDAGEQTILALPDHRLAYLDYEGPLTHDRGAVTRWDAGEYELLSELPDALRVRLVGRRCHGELTLTQDAASATAWTLHFRATMRDPTRMLG